MKRFFKWIFGAIDIALVCVVTIVFVRACDARHKPPLEAWHRPLPGEFRAADLQPTTTLADYLRREETLFSEMEKTVMTPGPPSVKGRLSRYSIEGAVNPLRFDKNWNHTFEMVPEGEVRGGVLLLHGLTDSPYSIRAEAEIYAREGFYALGLRVPGHGTVPGALTEARWEDWRAAARLGVRAVRQRVGDKLPLHVVGYSNGGALAVQYALDALGDTSLPRPDRVVLFSPMIGVTQFARAATAVAKLVGAVGAIPYFAQSRWMDIQPEYNPFKYNSFPAYAGQQTTEITREIQAEIDAAASSARIRALPPILAFVSIVDSTVETWSTIDALFGRLQDNGSELVLFDVNRSAVAVGLLEHGADDRLAALLASRDRHYRLDLVTNAKAGAPEVVARTLDAGAVEARDTPTGLAWPPQIFSLSHLATPFRPDDPLFGIAPDLSKDYGLRLGLLAPRGERGVLSVPIDQLMRLNCNPFFPYVEAKILEGIARPTPAAAR
ncbi:MAG TPA: alpha/beta fold hydrolase [Thermoanaerobaculia bacterium]|nr:alpha/beta fold hydrolase [Thermoanaerobaculia bacterium]